jgi:hypothetical protein
MALARLGALLTVFLAGCSCNDQDIVFPKVVPPGDGSAPSSFGEWLSFDRSPDGSRLTMSYYDRDRQALGYAVGVPTEDGTVAWAHEKVAGYPDDAGADPGDLGKYSSQKTAPDGTVWVAYRNATTGALMASHRTGPNEWGEPQVVDGGTLPGVGFWASLALDADGNPVIAHCDDANAAVRLSRWDGSAWTTAQVYKGLPVDQTDAYGVVTTIPAGVAYTDLVIDGDQELVAFTDTATGQLHLAKGAAGALEDQVVDAGGAWPSIHVEGQDLWIAYQDTAHEGLKFASGTGASWDIQTVELGPLRGADTALFVKDGQPAIVYQDGMENDVWLATRAGGTWTTAKVGGDGAATGFHNEVVQVAGQWFVGSYDFTSDSLFVKTL